MATKNFGKLFAKEIKANEERPKNQKRYSDNFKKSTVELLENGVDIRSITNVTSVSKGTIRLWRRQETTNPYQGIPRMIRLDPIDSVAHQMTKCIIIEFPSGLCFKIPIEL